MEALQAGVARRGGGGRSGKATARDSTSSPAVPTYGLATQTGTSQLSLSRPNLTQLRPPNFDNIEAHFGMWQNKFQAFFSSIGCLCVLKATDNLVMVGDMNVPQEELEQRHTKKDPKVWSQGGGLLLPERREQPLGRLLQGSADVWTDVILPRRYLGAPEETVYGGTASGEQELSAATVTAAAPGYAGASGRPQSLA